MQGLLSRIVLTASAIAAATLGCTQTSYVFDWTQGAQDSGGGTLNRLTTTYAPSTHRFTFRANFGAVPGNPSLSTQGFWLLTTGGGKPSIDGGELGILYFDATGGSPKLTAYAYNGASGNDSYADGSPAPGVQAPDRIQSSTLDTSWVNDLRVEDEADGTKTMLFDINAGGIDNHSPDYPGSSAWTGLAYGSTIGVTLRPVAGLTTVYDAGFLSSFNASHQGLLELTRENTTAVPEPASLLAIGMGVSVLLRRRRR